jgi:hypothetical protein
MAKDVVPAQPGRGRPTSLTPERAERLLTAIRAGNYYKTACEYAGIHYSTLRRWILKAEEPGAPQDLIDFRDALVKANAEFEVAAVAQLRKLGNEGNWLPIAWLLERRMPEKWGKQPNEQKIEINFGENSGAKTVAGIDITSDSMESMLNRLAHRTAIGAADDEVVDAEIVYEDDEIMDGE